MMSSWEISSGKLHAKSRNSRKWAFLFSQGQIHWGFLRNRKKRLILLDFRWIIEFPYQFSHRSKFLARKSKIFELLTKNLTKNLRIWRKIWQKIWEFDGKFDKKSEWESEWEFENFCKNLSEISAAFREIFWEFLREIFCEINALNRIEISIDRIKKHSKSIWKRGRISIAT